MKNITIQTVKDDRRVISPVKEASWLSAIFGGMRITISKRPDDYFLQIVDEKEVFELTQEQLLQIIRFYADYSAAPDTIIRYKNKYHQVE